MEVFIYLKNREVFIIHPFQFHILLFAAMEKASLPYQVVVSMFGFKHSSYILEVV